MKWWEVVICIFLAPYVISSIMGFFYLIGSVMFESTIVERDNDE